MTQSKDFYVSLVKTSCKWMDVWDGCMDGLVPTAKYNDVANFDVKDTFPVQHSYF